MQNKIFPQQLCVELFHVFMNENISFSDMALLIET